MTVRPLTARELEILRFLASGLSIPEIAAEMHLGRSTVRTYAGTLYAALGASGQAHAVALAYQVGILRAEGVCCRRAVGQWLRDAADKIASEEGTS